MDDSPLPKRRRPKTIVLAALIAVLVVVGSVLWAKHSGTRKAADSTLPRGAVPHSTGPRSGQTGSPGTASIPAPTGGPSPARTTPGPAREIVAAAAPTRFSIKGKAFTIKAHVCGMDYVRPLDPPGEQHRTVCWVRRDFGFAPGSNGQGTTYVLGHAWARDSLEVLNPLSAAATKQVLPLRRQGRSTVVSGVPTYPVTALDGYVVSLRNAHGLLRYTVRDAYAVAKEQAGNVAPLMAEHTRNRVVIITCGELNGTDYDFNIIVEAYLTSSVASARAS